MYRYIKSSETTIFWIGLLVLGLFRLVLVSDLNLDLIYRPHDASLYMRRAFHMLMGDGFGPYLSTTLIKVPGSSFWLAWVRWLGIPYVLSVNLIYIFSGFYFVAMLKRLGYKIWPLLFIFFALMINPASLVNELQMVYREVICLSFFIFYVGSLIPILSQLLKGRELEKGPIFILGVSLAMLLLFREESKLLYATHVFLLSLIFYLMRRREGKIRFRSVLRVFPLVIIPFVVVSYSFYESKSFVKRHYGKGILHEFGSGAFPEMIAAMRSVRAADKSPDFAISQGTLDVLSEGVPETREWISKLPGATRHNGTFFFTIKDTIFRLGLTPDLNSAEKYFRTTTAAIERACGSGKIKCEKSGSGLFTPINWFEKKHRKKFFFYSERAVSQMFTTPKVHTRPFFENEVITGMEWISPQDSFRMGSRYRMTAMAPFDSLRQYQRNGFEVNQDLLAYGKVSYEGPLKSFRHRAAGFFKSYDKILFFIAFLIFVLRFCLGAEVRKKYLVFNLLFLTMTFTFGLKALAMGYVSYSMGGLEQRMFYTEYAIFCLFSTVLIVDLLFDMGLISRSTKKALGAAKLVLRPQKA